MSRQSYPIQGMCICDHNEMAHTKTDHRMARLFPGQKWNGCRQCECPFFRQEDEISVGLRDGWLRIKPTEA
jgi:hypothetical protein